MAGTDDEKPVTPERKPFWKRPVTWIAGIVVAALGTVLTGTLGSFLEDNLPALPSTGDPVAVSRVSTYRSDLYGNGVAFPRGTTFGDAALADLNSMGAESTSWLEQRGGAALGSVFFQIVLTGNRTDGVRILGAEANAECGPPSDGLLFSSPPAGAEESIGLYFDLDSPNSRALSAADPSQPYFPANSISLTDGESLVLLIEAHTDRQYCAFSIDLSVLDGERASVQQVTLPEGRPFEVTAFIEESRYEQVYLGGVICSTWVQANEAYFAGGLDGSQCTGP
ncbi:hypothetical protein [Microbacterium sp. A93]|uniref:hypothetical protein n=1 Tax=Microbacterium sp. A93 TaxID=3450716 RepID=UPI003F4347AD